ncbi:hypothetical protein CNMCM5623_009720 [Aspergillus felis]|uniref:Uncharacterized protein n=1 Tax=Aspergillus felis TaxID=1287682 RepID=A0A8H6UJ65_9EURO|nr:hypothetical protein CNMCM5623_009720 [Aspergillus felis]
MRVRKIEQHRRGVDVDRDTEYVFIMIAWSKIGGREERVLFVVDRGRRLSQMQRGRQTLKQRAMNDTTYAVQIFRCTDKLSCLKGPISACIINPISELQNLFQVCLPPCLFTSVRDESRSAGYPKLRVISYLFSGVSFEELPALTEFNSSIQQPNECVLAWCGTHLLKAYVKSILRDSMISYSACSVFPEGLRESSGRSISDPRVEDQRS